MLENKMSLDESDLRVIARWVVMGDSTTKLRSTSVDPVARLQRLGAFLQKSTPADVQTETAPDKANTSVALSSKGLSNTTKSALKELIASRMNPDSKAKSLVTAEKLLPFEQSLMTCSTPIEMLHRAANCLASLSTSDNKARRDTWDRLFYALLFHTDFEKHPLREESHDLCLEVLMAFDEANDSGLMTADRQFFRETIRQSQALGFRLDVPMVLPLMRHFCEKELFEWPWYLLHAVGLETPDIYQLFAPIFRGFAQRGQPNAIFKRMAVASSAEGSKSHGCEPWNYSNLKQVLDLYLRIDPIHTPTTQQRYSSQNAPRPTFKTRPAPSAEVIADILIGMNNCTGSNKDEANRILADLDAKFTLYNKEGKSTDFGSANSHGWTMWCIDEYRCGAAEIPQVLRALSDKVNLTQVVKSRS